MFYRISTLAELVQHDDQRLAQMDTEAGVGVVTCNFVIVIDNRHSDIAQVHIRHINVCVLVTQPTSDCFEQRRLADAGLALQEEACLWVRTDKRCRLLEGSGLTKVDLSHF